MNRNVIRSSQYMSRSDDHVPSFTYDPTVFRGEFLDSTKKTNKQIRNKKTQALKWSTQGGNFLTTHTTNIDFVLT